MGLADAIKIYNTVRKKKAELRRTLIGGEVKAAKGIRIEGGEWEAVLRRTS